MLWLRLRFSVLTLAVVAILGGAAQAGHGTSSGCGCGSVPSGCESLAPIVKKIFVTEYVPEAYEGTRTVYKTEYRDEAFTTYKTECATEVRTRNVTVNKVVTETRDEARTVTKFIPTTEERFVTKNVWSTQQVTEIVRKTVDQGHYEYVQVPRKANLFEAIHEHGECCKPEHTKCKKQWVSCPVVTEKPVTKCVKVCTPVTEKVCVNVSKPVTTTEIVKVNVNKCIPETRVETYTVSVPKTVAVQSVRKVAISVPVTEKYTATRLVARSVEKEVVESPAAPSCVKKFSLFGLCHKCN